MSSAETRFPRAKIAFMISRSRRVSFSGFFMRQLSHYKCDECRMSIPHIWQSERALGMNSRDVNGIHGKKLAYVASSSRIRSTSLEFIWRIGINDVLTIVAL